MLTQCDWEDDDYNRAVQAKVETTPKPAVWCSRFFAAPFSIPMRPRAGKFAVVRMRRDCGEFAFTTAVRSGDVVIAELEGELQSEVSERFNYDY
jgi:hypothetical protein